ncbi:MAG: CPBP family intramembrane metalloprotease [Leptolinea sp.]|jgi:membrane protease YdiL (CAAX protease family)|nr:CPBP family intramembrane metalloprotease [Leptolinea sp.]
MKPIIYKPTRFFFIIYLVTYISWFIAAYISYQPDGEALYTPFMLPGLVAPFLTALWMIRSSHSKEMWKQFTGRLFNLHLINLTGFLPSLLIIPAAILISTFISIALGGDPHQLQFSEGFSFSIGLLPSLLVLVLAASFEELGWRSYAMDSLHSTRSYFPASLIFALLWAGWHLPLFFINGTYQNLIALENIWYAVNFVVSTIPMAIIISWICRLNRGSIAAAILFHFFINLSQEALQITQGTKCIETAIISLIAVIVVLSNKTMFFDKPIDEVTE